MTIRTFGVLTVLAVAASLAPSGARAQGLGPGAKAKAVASKDSGQAWKMPRTADGRPNFEGDWVNNTYTPFERPDELKDKAFFTAEEATAFAERGVERLKSQTKENIHYDDFIWMSEGTLRSVTGSRTSIVIDPPDGKVPPVNAEGQKRAQARTAARRNIGGAFDSVQNRPLSERCIIWGHEGPPMQPVGYNANIKIVQGKDTIVIIQEMTHNTRVIPLVDKPVLGSAFKHLSGESRGHWEGDTLVVVTSNYTDKTAFRGASENMKVTERFNLTDADTITYGFTIEDPATWDRPWKGEIAIKKADGEIWEYACHEGNYGMRNIMSAQRAEEAQAAAAAAAAAETTRRDTAREGSR